MALETDRVNVGAVQKPRIRPSVRRVACDAAFRLDHVMLVDKWSRRLCMALGADSILLRGSAQSFCPKRAVRIVTIRATDQSLFNLVVKGHAELRLDVGMALEAEFRLLNFEQLFRGCAGVDAVAAKNVELTIDSIRANSEVLCDLESTKAIKVLGAIYNLETGKVDFLS